MNTETSINVRFPLLTTERYLNAVESAKDTIRKRVQPPTPDQFKNLSVSAYPAWFSKSIIGSLALVMLASFFISSGKQVAAFGLVYDDLPGRFTHLSPFWSNLSIVF